MPSVLCLDSASADHCARFQVILAYLYYLTVQNGLILTQDIPSVTQARSTATLGHYLPRVSCATASCARSWAGRESMTETLNYKGAFTFESEITKNSPGQKVSSVHKTFPYN